MQSGTVCLFDRFFALNAHGKLRRVPKGGGGDGGHSQGQKHGDRRERGQERYYCILVVQEVKSIYLSWRGWILCSRRRRRGRRGYHTLYFVYNFVSPRPGGLEKTMMMSIIVRVAWGVGRLLSEAKTKKTVIMYVQAGSSDKGVLMLGLRLWDDIQTNVCGRRASRGEGLRERGRLG